MKKLIEALHVIQEECKEHTDCAIPKCKDCPLGTDDGLCMVVDLVPGNWKINDEMQKALL